MNKLAWAKNYLFLSLLVFVFAIFSSGKFTHSVFAINGTAHLNAVFSCNVYEHELASDCIEGVVVDRPYIMVTGQSFDPSNDTIVVKGIHVTAIGTDSTELIGSMPANLAAGNTVSVVVAVNYAGGLTNSIEADILCDDPNSAACNGGSGPTPTPTPVGGTPTPTPVGGTPTPTPPPAGTSTLGCAAQGLVADPGGSGLCVPPSPFKPAAGSIAASTSIGALLKTILDILLTLGGIVAVLFIIIGGYQYVTSRGSEDQAKAGRKTITYAVVGLVAVLLAYMIVSVLTNTITQGRLF